MNSYALLSSFMGLALDNGVLAVLAGGGLVTSIVGAIVVFLKLPKEREQTSVEIVGNGISIQQKLIAGLYAEIERKDKELAQCEEEREEHRRTVQALWDLERQRMNAVGREPERLRDRVEDGHE